MTEISNFENIYNQNIFQKKFMNQNRRFTRSMASGLNSSTEREVKNREEAQLRNQIHEAVTSKNFHKAFALLKSVSLRSHWVSCMRAQLLFELGKIKRALTAVRSSLKTQQQDCLTCFELLIKIIQKSRFDINNFKQDIDGCLSSPRLPPKIRIELQRIQSKMDSPTQALAVNNRQFQELTAYYQGKGLIFKKVSIVEVSQDYRVAKANSTINPNEVIIFVPQQQLITLEMAKSMKQVGLIAKQQAKLKSPKHCLLAVFLLLHEAKGKKSPYYNYIQCMPRRIDNFPIYYEDELIQQLKGTYFLTILQRKRQDLKEDLQQILQILPELNKTITYEKFVWARMIVCSRIFGFMINGIKTDALVPIADMLNHKTPKLTSWFFSEERKGFIVQNSSQQIYKGQQIFDSYGFKCNSRFLLNYGFTIPFNSFNQVLVKLKKPRNWRVSPPQVKLSTCLTSQELNRVLAYYRQAFLHSDPLNPLIGERYSEICSFVSNENQRDVWRQIQVSMKEQLQNYKTTIKFDERLLQSSDELATNLKNCVQIRLGEKRILDFYHKMAKRMVEYFSHSRKAANLAQYEDYLRELSEPISSSQ